MHVSEGIPSLRLREGRGYREKVEQTDFAECRGNREKSEGTERETPCGSEKIIVAKEILSRNIRNREID